jgi:hypothetical protein
MHSIPKTYNNISGGKSLCTQIHIFKENNSTDQYKDVNDTRINILV